MSAYADMVPQASRRDTPGYTVHPSGWQKIY